ncbi:MAG: polysaccharide biosynthesis/export family protein [Dysgonamonadaceae bacterium]|jgi:polysaccharide export outer membrane protein|nr:polysaccharide biosynthesis/export family protein [Dysgonamonadaceae bacterium]
MMKLKYLSFIFFMVLLFSCKSVPDDLIMFKDLTQGRNLTGTFVNTENSKAVILPGNVLRIVVSSGNVMDAKTYDQFNLLPITPSTPAVSASSGASGEMEFQTYTVDEKGEIDFPKFGKIKVQGLTHFDLEALLLEKLKPHMSDPVVRVSITQNYVKVLGEVEEPGLIEIENRHNYSVVDAIAEAGGITAVGDRKRVKLIREENGRLESVILDLTSSDIFTSPYYYLKQNDILVIDMNSTRRKDAQYGTSDNYKLAVISTIVGALSSTLTIIFLLLDRVSK